MHNEADETLAFVRYCSHCGESLLDPVSLVNQYSDGSRSVCFWWCHACGAKGEVTVVERVTAPELTEGAD